MQFPAILRLDEKGDNRVWTWAVAVASSPDLYDRSNGFVLEWSILRCHPGQASASFYIVDLMPKNVCMYHTLLCTSLV